MSLERSSIPLRTKARFSMSAPDIAKAVVAEWAAKAENDLITAAHTLKLRADCPTDTVCFHAQQCVEKYLKALLVLSSIPFAKTHDIEFLSTLLVPALQVDL